MKKHALLFSIVFGISLQIIFFASHEVETQPIETPGQVVLFFPRNAAGGHAAPLADIVSYRNIAQELGYSHKTVDHKFINRRGPFLIAMGGVGSRFSFSPEVSPTCGLNR
jgi:hypothetical protein